MNLSIAGLDKFLFPQSSLEFPDTNTGELVVLSDKGHCKGDSDWVIPYTVIEIDEILKRAKAEFSSAGSSHVVRELEAKYLGKKGELSEAMKQLGSLAPEDRAGFGKALNDAKAEVSELVDSMCVRFRDTELSQKFESERIDTSLPGRRPVLGQEHVLQQTINKIKRVFSGLGFEFVSTPELEKFAYNFDALNYPEDHPAMDDQDTFFVTDELLLRTQMTAFQGRLLENHKPPFKFFTVGRTYRNETVDRTHSHTFHQIDAFLVDEGISMADLKGTLTLFARSMFGDDVKVRFRPDFFPFVEPGVDYAISTQKLFDGKWVELGGAGLVHPKILQKYGIDTEKYSGFAFGLGVDRIPMMAYGVTDLRLFLENDLRFLEQFPS